MMETKRTDRDPQNDPNYIIIKRWLTEDDQDKLFEHTRKLRQSRQGQPDIEIRRDRRDEEDDSSDDESACSSRKERRNVITVKDAASRKLVFPFQMCNTWAVSTTLLLPDTTLSAKTTIPQGIHELIVEAFKPIQRLYPRVAANDYDLFNSRGEMILPTVWSALIQPGAAVSMRMRPRPGDEIVKIGSVSNDSVYEPHSLDTNVEEHREKGEGRGDGDGKGDEGEVGGRDGKVDDEEVRRVVEGLLEKYTLPLFA